MHTVTSFPSRLPNIIKGTDAYSFTLTILKSKVFRLLILVIGFISFTSYHYTGHINAHHKMLYQQNPVYNAQVNMYEYFRTSHADIVMLGDSLTYFCNWNELLGRSNIANRGILGDIASGYLHRLSYVYKLNPRLCFIEGGVNDVLNNYQPEEIFLYYKQIIDTLEAHNITPVIQSTLFVAAVFPHAKEMNLKISKLNEMLIEYAHKHSIEYLDINSLASKDGFLRNELTCDGLHLSTKGYMVWVPEVEKILVKNRL